MRLAPPSDPHLHRRRGRQQRRQHQQFADLGAPAVTDGSPAGALIKGVHVSELRSALDAALTALGLTVSAYTNASLTGAPVKAVDYQELRDRVR